MNGGRRSRGCGLALVAALALTGCPDPEAAPTDPPPSSPEVPGIGVETPEPEIPGVELTITPAPVESSTPAVAVEVSPSPIDPEIPGVTVGVEPPESSPPSSGEPGTSEEAGTSEEPETSEVEPTDPSTGETSGE
ncbi:hypothetical protein [Actinoplanes sp. OR16]|uniref:hypothetical protein n=1 Tax=Actinoplanes sp. OR16 TaxID=946334 RepID=UPI000FD99EFB|nr:hypothetical protein [Actinoplanes sp. OR16]